MSIKQANIGNHNITYDNQTREIIAFEPTPEHAKYKQQVSLEILSKRDEFKKRGAAVVIPEYVDYWGDLVDNSLNDLDIVWYNGACIEAALQCMERLHQALPVDEAYKPIDIQNPNTLCVHFGMELSGWQNYAVSSLVGSYHVRGQEFCDYRNAYVNHKSSGIQK